MLLKKLNFHTWVGFIICIWNAKRFFFLLPVLRLAIEEVTKGEKRSCCKKYQVKLKIQNLPILLYYSLIWTVGVSESLIWTITVSDLDRGLLAVQIRVMYCTPQIARAFLTVLGITPSAVPDYNVPSATPGKGYYWTRLVTPLFLSETELSRRFAWEPV